MYLKNIKEVYQTTVNAPGAVNAVKQVLIGPDQGWDGWVMRLFTLSSAGCSPRHSHPWPHINFVVKGRGILYFDGEEFDLEPGSSAFVPADAIHQFTVRGDQDLVFICIVPEQGDV